MERTINTTFDSGEHQERPCSETKDTAALKKKRPYERMKISKIKFDSGNSILASSAASSTQIMASGHELGITFDMSSGATDPITGKEFSHEWGESTGL